MPNVSVSYYVWKEGAKRKSPTPKFNIVTQETKSTKDDTFSFLVPSVLEQLPLAFVSVTGSANGHYVIVNYPNPVYLPTPSDPPDFTNPPPAADHLVVVNVAQDSDLTVSVWYLPIGGGPGGGGTGAYIDSFNVDTGKFFYDPNIANDFVTVSPDGGLTANANELGWVPTASAETITSHDQILKVPFLNWIVMTQSAPGAAVVNGRDLKVGAHTNVAAIAFFGTQNRHERIVSFGDLYEVTWHRLYPGEEVDAPRPGDPEPPQWRTAVKQLTVLLAMHASSRRLVVEGRLREEIQSEVALSVQALTERLNRIVQPRG